jgi:hypothetical protein
VSSSIFTKEDSLLKDSYLNVNLSDPLNLISTSMARSHQPKLAINDVDEEFSSDSDDGEISSESD